MFWHWKNPEQEWFASQHNHIYPNRLDGQAFNRAGTPTLFHRRSIRCHPTRTVNDIQLISQQLLGARN